MPWKAVSPARTHAEDVNSTMRQLLSRPDLGSHSTGSLLARVTGICVPNDVFFHRIVSHISVRQPRGNRFIFLLTYAVFPIQGLTAGDFGAGTGCVDVSVMAVRLLRPSSMLKAYVTNKGLRAGAGRLELRWIGH